MKILSLSKHKSTHVASWTHDDPVIQKRLDSLKSITGLMSKERAAEFMRHAKEVRSEWDRSH